MRATLGAVLVLALAGGAAADEKKEEPKKDEKVDARKLVGKWEMTRPPVPAKVTAEYRGDEKMAVTVSIGGADETVSGSYKLDGNKLTQALKTPDGEEKRTVILAKLTDDVLEYEVDGVPFTFKRVKKDKDKK